jgi:hypothetical protein
MCRSRAQVECLAGQSGTRSFLDGMGPSGSLLGDPAGICVDPFDTIYFCDYAHNAIRAISPEGSVHCTCLVLCVCVCLPF